MNGRLHEHDPLVPVDVPIKKETKQGHNLDKTQQIVITAPKMQTLAVGIISTAPYCQNRFSEKARQQLIAQQEQGSTARAGRKREAKDFRAGFLAAQYKATAGWYGMPASAFRNAAISACRIVGFKMTNAKLAIFVEADGYDAKDSTPLIRLYGAAPVMRIHTVRNATGVPDQRPRAFFDEWRATVRVTFDADMFRAEDIINLFARIGLQVGIGDGRPDSTNSAGMGWGTFRLTGDAPVRMQGAAKKKRTK